MTKTDEIIEKEFKLRNKLKTATDKNIFITAGAGAGKSTLMVDRLVYQAALGNQPFDQTVAITFTNKAATDLEEKVMEKVNENKTLAASLPNLTIGTIHSFCQKLLDERPFEVGLSPGFTVLEDEAEKQAILRQLLAEVINDDELGKIQQSLAVLQVADISPFTYFHLLESKVGYTELGIKEVEIAEEPSLSLDKEAADLMESFETDFAEIKNERYIWYLMKPMKLAFRQNKKNSASLKWRIETLYDTEESLDKLLSALLIKKGQEDLVNCNKTKYENVQEAYHEDKTVFVEGLIELFKEKFIADFQELSFEKEDWLEDFCVQAELVKDDQAWLEKLQQLTESEQARTENIDEIFDHFFETPINLMDKTTVFSNPGFKKYEELTGTRPINSEDFIAFINNPGLARANLNKESENAIKKLFNKYNNYIGKLDSHAILYHLHQIFNEVIVLYEAQKLKENLVSQNDLLKKTYDLLRNEETRRYFHEKYQYIYIDEFQDTDPLQTKILFYLTSETEPSSVEDAKPVPGSLFIVGDPKQSIYRFRNADLRIYQQVYEKAKEDAWLVEKLQINFRSNQALINWFDRAFMDKFGKNKSLEARKKQPDYDGMLYFPGNKEDSDELIADKVLTMKIPVKRNKKNQIINEFSQKFEAEKIANWIEAEYKKGKQDKTKQVHKYSDVMIITPGNYDVMQYVNALKEKGIPTSFSGKISVDEFPELVKLISIIDYIADPDQSKASKLFAQNWHIAFTIQHEIKEKISAKKKELEIDRVDREEAIKLMQDIHADLRKESAYQAYYQAKDSLDYYSKLARNLAPMNFMHKLVYELQFGIFPHKLTEVEYDASLSILTTFIESLKNEDIRTYADLALLLNQQLKDKKIDYEMLVKPKQEAVQIMNLHKTKGLEAEVVFLASPKTKQAFNPASYVERDGETELVEHSLFTKNDYGLVSTDYYSKRFLDMLAEIEEYEKAEDIRLLYVGATRAKRLLVIAQRVAEEPATWDELLSDDFVELAIEEEETTKSYRYIKIPEVTTAASKTEEEWLEAGTYTRKTPSGDRIKTDRVGAETEAKSEVSKVAADIQLLHAYKGPLWGNIIHTAYELMIKRELTSLEAADMREIIGLALEQYELTDKELAVFSENLIFVDSDRDARLAEIMANEKIHAAIQETVAPFFANETYKKWLPDYEAYPEVAVQAWLDKGTSAAYYEEEDKFAHVNGIIDLILVNKTDENKIIIVDYKTDALVEGRSVEDHHQELEKAYASQLNTYEKLMSDVYGKEVQAVYLYAVATDTFISMKTEANKTIAETVMEK